MAEFSKMRPAELLRREGFDCACGHHHATGLLDLRIGRGALRCLPEVVRELGCALPFIVCDKNTWDAAGSAVVEFKRKGGDAVARVGSGAYAVVYRRNG